MNKILITAQALMIFFFVGASFFLLFFPPEKIDAFTPMQYRMFGGLLLLYSVFRTYKVYNQK